MAEQDQSKKKFFQTWILKIKGDDRKQRSFNQKEKKRFNKTGNQIGLEGEKNQI